MIKSMTVQVGGVQVATVTRNEFKNRFQWKLGYRTENPVSLPLRWFRTVNELYRAIRETFPGATIRYQKRRQRRQAA